MKFNEWMEKVEKLQEKVNGKTLSRFTEAIYANGKTYEVTLGGEHVTASVDGNFCQLRLLRREYARAKEEFDAMLDALEERAGMFLEDTQELLLAVTEDDLPEVVLARMKGEKAAGDAIWMLEKKVEKKLRNLVRNLAGVHGCFNGFDFDCTAGPRVLGLTLSNRDHFMLQWGKIRAGCRAGLSDAFSFEVSTIKENLEFLGACLVIEARVEEFVNCCRFFGKLKK